MCRGSASLYTLPLAFFLIRSMSLGAINPFTTACIGQWFNTKRGKAVWLDIKMGKLNEAAMKEGVENCGCVLAIVTGPCVRADPAEGEKPEDNAYFSRKYCMNELRWARQAGVPIQPVIRREDKEKIGEFLGQAPEDLKDIFDSVEFEPYQRREHLAKAMVEAILARSLPLAAGSEPEARPRRF